jgi:hypothetical protein
MLWVIFCIDNDNTADLRSSISKEHSAHLNCSPFPVKLAGPLLDDMGTQAIGSLILVEANTRQAVEQFVASDPFAVQGVWKSVSVSVLKMSRNNL